MTINRRRLNKSRMATAAAAGLAGLDLTARYDAAGHGRRIASWNPPSTGPQGAIAGFERIRNRSRDATRNDWAAQSAAQKWATALVGVGIVPRWEADDLNELWSAHVKTADADGTLDLYGMQALAVRSWFVSGEVFIRRRPRNLSLVMSGKLAAPIQYQLVEADLVPSFDADMWPGLPEGNTIRQGIERNKYGVRVAYHMYREHPGDRPTFNMPDSSQLLRISADDVSHVFEPDRPGAQRGVSPLANVLVRLRASGDFEDAVLDRQKLSNLFVAFLKREMPDDWANLETDPLTGMPKWYDDRGNPLAGLEPGMFQELQAGESVTWSEPPGAAATFSEYMRTTHLGTAAGVGLPNELMTGDIKDTSDRTLRVVINEFRRFAEQRQWHLVIPKVCGPMVEWWAESLTLTGDISVSRLKEAKNPTFNPHGWEYIHPVQDVEGRLKAIEGGLTSQTAEILKRGDDPRKVFQQRATDQALAAELGIQSATAPAAAQPQAQLTMERFQAQARQDTMAFAAQLSAAVLGRKIEVAAPNVVVNQAPVEVTANVNLPNREIVTDEVQHDEAGRITFVKQTEKTIN